MIELLLRIFLAVHQPALYHFFFWGWGEVIYAFITLQATMLLEGGNR